MKRSQSDTQKKALLFLLLMSGACFTVFSRFENT